MTSCCTSHTCTKGSSPALVTGAAGSGGAVPRVPWRVHLVVLGVAPVRSPPETRAEERRGCHLSAPTSGAAQRPGAALFGVVAVSAPLAVAAEVVQPPSKGGGCRGRSRSGQEAARRRFLWPAKRSAAVRTLRALGACRAGRRAGWRRRGVASHRAHLMLPRAMAAPWRGGRGRTPLAAAVALLLVAAAAVGPSHHVPRVASAQAQHPHLMSMYPDKGATVGGSTVTIKGGPFTRTLDSKVRFSDLNGEVDEVRLFLAAARAHSPQFRPTSPRIASSLSL